MLFPCVVLAALAMSSLHGCCGIGSDAGISAAKILEKGKEGFGKDAGVAAVLKLEEVMWPLLLEFNNNVKTNVGQVVGAFDEFNQNVKGVRTGFKDVIDTQEKLLMGACDKAWKAAGSASKAYTALQIMQFTYSMLHVYPPDYVEHVQELLYSKYEVVYDCPGFNDTRSTKVFLFSTILCAATNLWQFYDQSSYDKMINSWAGGYIDWVSCQAAKHTAPYAVNEVISYVEWRKGCETYQADKDIGLSDYFARHGDMGSMAKKACQAGRKEWCSPVP